MLDVFSDFMSVGWLTVFLVLLEFVLRVGFVGVLLARRQVSPNARIAWIIVILSFPFLGWVIYLLIGRAQIGSRRATQHAKVQAIFATLECHPSHDPELVAALELPLAQQQVALLGESVSGSQPLRGNTAKLFGDSDEIIKKIIEDVDAAVDHCHFLFYIWLDDEAGTAVGEALIRAHHRGVTTRVLVDAVGSKSFLKSNLHARMISEGVAIRKCLPVSALRALLHRIDLRNHRKIVIIDGVIGWTGSQNMAAASFALKPKFAPWVDCAVRLHGPAAKDFQLLFAEDWYFETNELLEDEIRRPCIADAHGVITQTIASGPNYASHIVSEVIQACTQTAKEELILTTPYFVPDQATIVNLRVAAKRGIKVHLVLPKRNDSRLVAYASYSTYHSLLSAGVHIHEFEGGLLHAKTITIDRMTALITSANLDRRSFNLNFEAGILCYNTDFASQLRFLQQGYIDQSSYVSIDVWKKRGILVRMLENAAGLCSPLL